MEITLDTLINILSLLLGGGGGAFFVWRYQRKRAKAEASQAEASAAKELQDMYQQMIADAKEDREDRKRQNEELRQERDHYKKDRDEIREKLEKSLRYFMDWRLEADNDRSKMKNDIARLGRKVQMMAPFMCGDLTCKLRQRVVLSDDAAADSQTTAQKLQEIASGEPGQAGISGSPGRPADIEPLNSDEL